MTGRCVREAISTTIMVAVAVTLLALRLHDRARVPRQVGSAQIFVDDWQDWSNSAIRMGVGDARMVVATFMDFTCPFCRDLVPVLDSLRTEFGERVAIEFHFFPLFGHQHAGPAAAAADCAHDQGFFYEMYHALFTQADSFGTKPWGVLATEAGVPDVEKFGKCIRKSPKTFDRIYAGKELGRRIGVNGTPEVWVNGQLFLGRNLAAFRDRARELGLH